MKGNMLWEEFLVHRKSKLHRLLTLRQRTVPPLRKKARREAQERQRRGLESNIKTSYRGILK